MLIPLAIQAYGVFVFLWEFVIPLLIFVVAYWRILLAVRRQANVTPGNRQHTAGQSNPGTSKATTEQAGKRSSCHKTENGVNKAAIKRGSELNNDRHGGPSNPTGMSKAKVNVIKTMVLITVCHVLCLMPMDLYFFYRKFVVSYSCIYLSVY